MWLFRVPFGDAGEFQRSRLLCALQDCELDVELRALVSVWLAASCRLFGEFRLCEKEALVFCARRAGGVARRGAARVAPRQADDLGTRHARLQMARALPSVQSGRAPPAHHLLEIPLSWSKKNVGEKGLALSDLARLERGSRAVISRRAQISFENDGSSVTRATRSAQRDSPELSRAWRKRAHTQASCARARVFRRRL